MCAASPPQPPTALKLHVGHQGWQGLSPPNTTSFRKIGFIAPDEAVGIDIYTNATHVLRDTQNFRPSDTPPDVETRELMRWAAPQQGQNLSDDFGVVRIVS